VKQGMNPKKRPSCQPKLKSPSPFHSLALASCHCMKIKKVNFFSIIVLLLLLYITWKHKITILRNKRWKQENYLFLPLISITISKKQEKKTNKSQIVSTTSSILTIFLIFHHRLPKFLPHEKALPYEIEVPPSPLNCSFLTHLPNSLCNISIFL